MIINTIPLLGERSGVGKYVYEIASRLAAEPDLFRLKYYYGYYSNALHLGSVKGSQDEGYRKEYLAGKLKEFLGKSSFTKRAAKKLMGITTRVRAQKYDLYFEPNFIFHPGIRAQRRIVTVHDFSCIHYPEWHPSERVRYFEANLWASLKQADHIITVSEAIYQEAIHSFGFDADKVSVIYNGINHDRYRPPTPQAIASLRKTLALYGDFILFVGTLEPRKNISNLLLAYEALPESVKNRIPLVIAGATGWNNDHIHTQLQRMEQHVRILGFVPEDALPALYGAATLMIYPSWYEGFGLPLLEAMACGCPVVTSNSPALVEVSGNAAVHVCPDDVDALRDAMHELVEDPTSRASLVEAGLTQAARFSWDSSTHKHAALFSHVCNH